MPFLPLTDPPEDDRPAGPAVVVAVHEGRSVFVVDDDAPGDGLFLGTLDGRWCFAVDVRDDPDVDLALFRDLRQLWDTLDEVTWTLAGRAAQLVDWDRTHRFCGQCAAPTEAVRGERARRCPRCGLLAFPRLAPAIITLIERDDGRILLARNPNFPAPFFSLLAGFVEPGETLEQAVERETFEEVGSRSATSPTGAASRGRSRTRSWWGSGPATSEASSSCRPTRSPRPTGSGATSCRWCRRR
jgi:hypothetical protein